MATKRSTGVGLHVEGADKFSADLKKANSAIRLTTAEVKKLDATYGKGSTNSDYLTQRTQALTKQLDTQRQKTATLREQLAASEATGKATTAQLEKYRLEILKSETAEENLKRQINEANDTLEEQARAAEEAAKAAEEQARAAEEAEKAERELAEQAEQANRKIREQEEAVKRTAKGLDDFSKKAGKVGDALTRALTIPIAGMGTYALNATMELEDAMASVQTLPGVVSGSAEAQAAQMAAYTDAILDASNATHVAAEELAAAQYQAISAGTAASDSVALVERSAKAAKSGMAEATTVVDGATSILNAWKEEAGGIDHVLDAMMVTQNEGKTTIGDLASNIGQVTGLAPQLGVALDEVLASVAALTKGGVQTSSAINGLKAVFSNIMKPTAEAQEEAERLGLSFSAAALQAQGFTGFLESVMEATKGDSESLAKLFGSVEGLAQIMALGTTQAGEYARILGEIRSSEGAVDEAFAVRTSSRAEKLKGSMNELRNSGIQLAENLTPAVDAVTDLIGGTASVISEMDEGTQKTLVNVLGVAAAIGPATKALAGLTSTVAKLIPMLSGPWGLAAAGTIAAGSIVIALSGAETSAERLDKAVSNMELKPDESKLNGLAGRVQAAIDAVDAEKVVNVTAHVNADLSGLDGLTEDATEVLQGRLNAAMKDYWLTWAEYDRLKRLLDSQDFSGVAEAGMSSGDSKVVSVSQELQAAIDEAEALLWTVFVSGDSVTAQEIAQLEVLMQEIAAYREQLLTTQADVDTLVSTTGQEIQKAIADNRLNLQEYEEIKRKIDEEARPAAVEAMEDAATASIGTELDATLTEFEALLDAINAHGGDMTEAEIARIDQYLTEIEGLNARIDAINIYRKAMEEGLEGEEAVQLTASGYGTDESAIDAAGTIEGYRRAAAEHEEERMRKRELAYREAQLAAETEEERDQLKAEYEVEKETHRQTMDAINATAQEAQERNFEGWVKSDTDYSKEAKFINDMGVVLDELSALYASGKTDPENGIYKTPLEWFLQSSYARTELGHETARAAGLYRPDGSLISTDQEIEDWYEFATNDQYDALMRGQKTWENSLAMLMDTFSKQYDENYADGSMLLTMYQGMLDGGVDPASLDVSMASGTLANLMRVMLWQDKGDDAVGSEAMEAIGSAIEEALPEVEETAGEAAEAIGAAATDLKDGAPAGRKLALSLAAGIQSGSPIAIAAAQGLAAQVSASLNGMYTHAPGAVMPDVASVMGAGPRSYDFSTNVSVGTGVFTTAAGVNAMAERLNTLSNLKWAGVGRLTRNT